MSVVPNDLLKPSSSLDLITFEINDKVVTSPYRKDFFNSHLAFWKSIVIRNLQATFNCSYRTDPALDFKVIPPLSERPIQGWGSYFEVTTTDPSPIIEIDYIGVAKQNAVRT